MVGRVLTKGRGRRRVHVPLVVGAIALALGMSVSAAAQTVPLVEIGLGTVVRTDPGVRTVLASRSVPEDLVGRTCTVESEAENNSSIHPGNDVVVSSGGGSVVLRDVEGASGKQTRASSTLTLGASVTVTLIMGDDGVFSAGAAAVVRLDCSVPTTTTAAPPTTVPTSTVPTSTVPSTTVPGATSTTTIEPPVSSMVTTTTIDGPTSTIVPPGAPTTSPPLPPPSLAVTGPGETLVLAIVAFVLFDIGYLAWSASRPARDGVDE